MFNFSVKSVVLALPSENSPSRENNNTLNHYYRQNLQAARSTPLLIKTASKINYITTCNRTWLVDL